MIALALLLLAAPPKPPLYEELFSVRNCHTVQGEGQALYCEFKLPGLHVTVTGVGDANVGFAVEEFDPKLWLVLDFAPGVDHCIRILRSFGLPPLEATAQINLNSARVYPDYKSCRANKS